MARAPNLLCHRLALHDIEADKSFRPDPLIDVLGIPDAILRAPIGLRDLAPANG